MQVGRARIAPGPSCTPLWVSPTESLEQWRPAGHPFALTERSQWPTKPSRSTRAESRVRHERRASHRAAAASYHRDRS